MKIFYVKTKEECNICIAFIFMYILKYVFYKCK